MEKLRLCSPPAPAKGASSIGWNDGPKGPCGSALPCSTAGSARGGVGSCMRDNVQILLFLFVVELQQLQLCALCALHTVVTHDGVLSSTTYSRDAQSSFEACLDWLLIDSNI